MDHATTQAVEQALELLNSQKCQEAAVVLAKVLRSEPSHEQAWHILSFALTDLDQRSYALRRVLQINPENRAARLQLARLSERTVTPPAGNWSAAPAVGTAVEVAAAPGFPEAPSAAGELALNPGGTLTVSREALRGPGSATSALWASPVVMSALPGERAFPFPRLAQERNVTHSRWEWLKIRRGLAWRRFKMDWAVFAQSRLAMLGVVLLTLFGLMAIAHPILMRTVWPRAVYDPVTGFDMMIFQHPSPPAWIEGGSQTHLLGTDTLGRDVLSMLLAATTPTFIIGLTAALTTAFAGTLMSVAAAYFRGGVDVVITNLADVFLLLPAPVVMVIIGARFRDLGPVPLGLIYGFVTGAGPTAIVLRTHALQVMSKPYMEAAQIAGGGGVHIITKHLLPAMLPLAALQMMIAVTGAVVADGFISFFGLTRTVSNWGTLIYDAFVYGQLGRGGTGIWHMLLPGALCFSLFAMGFYLISRGLHRVASPTIREEQAVA